MFAPLTPEKQALSEILERTISDDPKVGLAYVSIGGHLVVFPDGGGTMIRFRLEQF